MEGSSPGKTLPDTLAFLGRAAAGLVVHCQGAAGSLSSAQLGTQDIGMLAELEDHDHFDMAKGIFGYGASWTFPVGLCHRLAPLVHLGSGSVSNFSVWVSGW
ncbi:hypothetical protein PVAP13_3KG537033 [Panicum virgatum]|uniref:Uncharacterized protein n=1 Tax=Panicum virgatum TaxID=38727 RepID=A0A8T0VG47_PANVG|nr:hypothetical protein PVAP13_3KG537033 [Panicum virgatum]